MLKFEDAVKLFRNSTLSPREYLEQSISVVEERENKVQAFSFLDLKWAREQADAATKRYRCHAPLSPIDGMPIGIKDIFDTSRIPTSMGSDIYRDWQPKVDANAVDAIRLGGGVILGKTRTSEFAIGRATITTNPHDATRTPGGSSSGTAAGVASGMICAGLGTQTQGSILRPASFCGVVGYKPTWGMLSLSGVHPVSHSHDHLGVIAQSLDVAWSVAHCIATHRPTAESFHILDHSSSEFDGIAPRRIAILRTKGYAEIEADALRSFEDRLDSWRRKGVEVVEPSEDSLLADFCLDLDKIPAFSIEMMARDMSWPYAGYCQNFPEAVSKKIHDLVAVGSKVTYEKYQALIEFRDGLLNRLELLSSRYDAFVLPAASGIAPVGLENTGSRTMLTYASFLGTPAFSLPLNRVNGMPLGLQLIGKRHDDFGLLCRSKWLTLLN